MGREMAISNRKLNKDFIKKVTFQQNLEGGGHVYRKGLLGRGNAVQRS